jgi:adenine/guanine phosphoribosyltransferase-like PRPP-binding protein
MAEQIEGVKKDAKIKSVDDLLASGGTWEVT